MATTLPDARRQLHERLLDVPAVAEILGVSEMWVRRAIKAGDLPHRRIGRGVRFAQEDLSDFLERCRVAA